MHMKDVLVFVQVLVAMTVFADASPFLALTQKSGTPEYFDIQTISKITFNSDQMIISGPGSAFAVADIWKITFEQTMGAERATVSGAFSGRVAPNPFGLSTQLAVTVGAPGMLRATLYDCQGRRVAGLINKRVTPGTVRADWTGRCESGVPVAAGRYIIHVDFNGQTFSRQILYRK